MLVSTPLPRPPAADELFAEVVPLAVPVIVDVKGLSPGTVCALLLRARSGEENDDNDEEADRPGETEEEGAAVFSDCHSSQAAEAQQAVFTTTP